MEEREKKKTTYSPRGTYVILCFSSQCFFLCLSFYYVILLSKGLEQWGVFLVDILLSQRDIDR